MNTLSRVMSLALLGAVLIWAAPAEAQNMPQQQSPENPEAVEEARQAAEEWLALTDSGSFDESWNQAATLLQDEISQDEWASQAESMVDQLGSIEERDFVGGRYRESDGENPNTPEGEFVIMQYETAASEFDQNLIEIVATIKEGEDWKVVGHNFRRSSPQQAPQQPQQPPNK